jgi:hypothetical protein
MRLARLAPSVLCIAACSATAPGPSRPPVRSTAAPAVTAGDIVFTGMCDASGAVPLSDQLFAVADDEDNVLRVYDAHRGGAPLAASDLSPALPIERASGHKRAGRRSPEIDIEAATRVGDVALWITSHGRSSSGKERPERLFLFGTTAPRTAAAIDIVGTPYASLVDDLTADARFAAFRLDEAAQRPPKEPGGLNIEGLTARPDGAVLIGFRNPVPEGRALLVPLLNPLDVIDQKPARLGDPILLDLGGLGVRSLSWWRGRYLIAAGPTGSEDGFRLFAWSGEGPVAPIDGVDLGALHPEGFFTPDGLERILVLSDDGSEPIDGVACKRLDDGGRKRFRGRWLAMERL